MLCRLSFHRTSAFDGEPSDNEHNENVEVLDEVEAAGDQPIWKWKFSVQRFSVRDKLNGVPSAW